VQPSIALGPRAALATPRTTVPPAAFARQAAASATDIAASAADRPCDLNSSVADSLSSAVLPATMACSALVTSSFTARSFSQF
jgi:hypothetical protein